jgi:membrane fusion protein (multidrug efflux system)
MWMKARADTAAAVEKKAAEVKEKKLLTYELAPNDVAAVHAGELSVSLPVSGSLTPLNQATVKAKVAAEVRATLVPEGVAVTRGQVVMRFDTADLQARLATQQALEEETRARLALARKTHDSQAKLLNQKFISQTAFDTALNGVELAQAGVKSAESQTSIARRALEDGVVRAPIDGVISKRYVQPGEKVAQDMPLFTVVSLNQLILEAQVPTADIPRVKLGQRVSFNVEGFSGRSFSGKVARINPVAETGTRAVTVYISAENADQALKGGMFAKGSIVLEKTGVVTLLPIAALRQEGGGTLVHKVENGAVVAQPVKLGLRNEDEGMIEVTEGLAPGTHVILARLAGVKHGSKVSLPESAVKVLAAAPVIVVKN